MTDNPTPLGYHGHEGRGTWQEYRLVHRDRGPEGHTYDSRMTYAPLDGLGRPHKGRKRRLPAAAAAHLAAATRNAAARDGGRWAVEVRRCFAADWEPSTPDDRA